MANVTVFPEKTINSLPTTPRMPREDKLKVKYQTNISIAFDSKNKVENVRSVLQALLDDKDPKYASVIIPVNYMHIIIKDLIMSLSNLDIALEGLIYCDSYIPQNSKYEEENRVLKNLLLKQGIERANSIIRRVVDGRI